MKNLSAIASKENMQQAIENSAKKSNSTKKSNELSNRTVFNSTIANKQSKVSETSKIDFALCLLSSVADSFHQSQVLELLQLVDCKRTTVAKHVNDKQNVYADYLTVDTNTKIFTVVNSEFFKSVVVMSEFKQQLLKHASKLYELLDSNNSDFEIAHYQNVNFEQALIMNAEYDKQKKAVKKTAKRANSKK